MDNRKTVLKWRSQYPNALHWRDEPIPWLMVLRGFLPPWMGGEPVYEAVARTGHFSTKQLRADYLKNQYVVAVCRQEVAHEEAIMKLRKALQLEISRDIAKI